MHDIGNSRYKVVFDKFRLILVLILGIVAQILLVTGEKYLYNSSFIDSIRSFISLEEATFLGQSLFVLFLISLSFLFSKNTGIETSTLLWNENKVTNIAKSKWLIIFILCLFGFASSGFLLYKIGVQQEYLSYYPVFLIVSLFCLGLGFYLTEHGRIIIHDFRKHTDEILFLLCLTLLATALLSTYLTSMPYKVHNDEAEMIIHARPFLENNNINILGFSTWYHVPNFGFYVMSIFLSIFGDNITGLRLNSVALGILTIPLYYVWVRAMFNKYIAAMASVILVSSHIYIAFFRVGHHYSQSIFVLVLSLLLFTYGLKNNSKCLIFFSGVTSALGFYVYFASRVVVVVLLLFLMFLILTTVGKRLNLLKHLGVLILGFFITFSPLVVSTPQIVDALNSRASDVYLLDGEGYQHTKETMKTDDQIKIFLESFKKSIKVFTLSGDSSGQYGTDRPFLDFFSGVLLIVGMVILTMQLFNPVYTFIALLFWIILFLGQVLTIDAPFFPRLIIIIPIVSLICGMALYSIVYKFMQSYKDDIKVFQISKSFNLLVISLLVLIIAANFEHYFFHYIGNNISNSHIYLNRILGEIINKQSEKYDYYLIYKDRSDYTGVILTTEPSFTLAKDAVENISSIPIDLLPLLKINKAYHKGICVICEPTMYEACLKRVLSRYDRGDLQVIKNNSGQVLLYLLYLNDHDVSYKNNY